jgi:hypothetical protein
VTGWQKYLRSLWWKIPLIAGLVFILWRGTDQDKLDYIFVMIAIGVLVTAWDIGRHVWQGWQGE